MLQLRYEAFSRGSTVALVALSVLQRRPDLDVANSESELTAHEGTWARPSPPDGTIRHEADANVAWLVLPQLEKEYEEANCPTHLSGPHGVGSFAWSRPNGREGKGKSDGLCVELTVATSLKDPRVTSCTSLSLR